MPVHDWKRVDPGIFHAFHSSWVTHLSEALNGGLLPPNFYALPEQNFKVGIADILTLHSTSKRDEPGGDGGAVATVTPPRVGRRVVASPSASYRALRRTLTIRHVSGHRVVALIEILSPSNKDRAKSVEDFVEKAQSAIQRGIHLLLVDLFPPGIHDPQGMPVAVWEPLREPGELDDFPPPGKPLTLAAIEANQIPEAYFEAIAVGDQLPAMPLFLPSGHIDVPLEATYIQTFRGTAEVWRAVLEGRAQAS